MLSLGPAYHLITVINKQVYVMARGSGGDLIASYDFQIHVGGEYSIWLLAYGTSAEDNGVKFRIDDLDDYFWHTTYIEKGIPMWTQYMYEVFGKRRYPYVIRVESHCTCCVIMTS